MTEERELPAVGEPNEAPPEPKATLRPVVGRTYVDRVFPRRKLLVKHVDFEDPLDRHVQGHVYRNEGIGFSTVNGEGRPYSTSLVMFGETWEE